ncbi:hypothetical protein F5Y14DRAFT_433368 [Nemania sp. NC0429]|nr:hypothetical protein F5Y14DRAFT_433368 [Nemania sp. NC0429]
MHFHRIFRRLSMTIHLLAFAAAAAEQPDDPADFHIAIIGAGIAGASAAYHLRRLSASGTEQTPKLYITVYETSPVVGGQVKNISPPESDRVLEAGASYFFEDDWCLTDTAQSLRLDRKVAHQGEGAVIWNGHHLLADRFCFHDVSRAATPRFWPSVWGIFWKTVKLFIRGNPSEVKSEWELGEFRSDMAIMQDKLQSLGRNGSFDSLQDELDKVGLGSTTRTSAEEFLRALSVPRSSQTSVVEPCVEALFGLNIKEATGLHIVASMGSTRPPPVAIQSGNGELITRMLRESSATLHVDSQVTKVENGSQRRFSLTVASPESTKQTRREHDVVVFTGDSMARLRPGGSNPPLKNIQHHITHFSTDLALDARIIGLELGWNPSTLLATENSSYIDREIRIMRLTTFPEFYIDHRGCEWDDECDQFVHVHRVDSRTPLSEAKLRFLAEGINDPEWNHIIWSHTQSWNHTLAVDGSNQFDPAAYQTEPEPGLLNSNSGLISMMEMSCRMGRNAAWKLLQTRLLPNGISQGDQIASFKSASYNVISENLEREKCNS